MDIKRCCFAGHSEVYDSSIKSLICQKAAELIENENVREFWVGNYGHFDYYAANAVKELKAIYNDISIELVIPYLTYDINANYKMYNEEYDDIIMAQIPENTPKRFYIIKANEYMVNNSDFCICYINHTWGGSARTYKYAKSRAHIKVINLGSVQDDIL